MQISLDSQQLVLPRVGLQDEGRCNADFFRHAPLKNIPTHPDAKAKLVAPHSAAAFSLMHVQRNLQQHIIGKRFYRKTCVTNLASCNPGHQMTHAVLCSCGLAGTKCWRLPVCKSGLAKLLPSTRAAAGGSVGSAQCLSSLVGS